MQSMIMTEAVIMVEEGLSHWLLVLIHIYHLIP